MLSNVPICMAFETWGTHLTYHSSKKKLFFKQRNRWSQALHKLFRLRYRKRGSFSGVTPAEVFVLTQACHSHYCLAAVATCFVIRYDIHVRSRQIRTHSLPLPRVTDLHLVRCQTMKASIHCSQVTNSFVHGICTDEWFITQLFRNTLNGKGDGGFWPTGELQGGGKSDKSARIRWLTNI